MAKRSLTVISRRRLMTATLAAPLIGSRSAEGDAGGILRFASDPVVARAEAWIGSKARINAMTLEWQALENQLWQVAREQRVKFEKACRSRLPEARAMCALDRHIRAGYRDLAQSAEEISAMSAASIDGAIAKIALGVKVQGPYDWQDNALELAEGGLAELRALIRR